MAPYGLVWCYMVLYGTNMVPYGSILWYHMVPCSTIWWHMVPYDTIVVPDGMVPYGTIVVAYGIIGYHMVP